MRTIISIENYAGNEFGRIELNKDINISEITKLKGFDLADVDIINEVKVIRVQKNSKRTIV